MIASGEVQGDEHSRTIVEVSKEFRCRQNRRLMLLRDKPEGNLSTARAAAGIEMA